MPYKSEAQRKFFHANKKKLEKEGVNVKEWDKESKGLKLPNKVIKKNKQATGIINRTMNLCAKCNKN